MSTKASYTPEEWNLIRKAPLTAGLVVVAASPSGPLGVIKESFAIGKLIGETKVQGGSNELVDALVADLATAEGRQQAQPSEMRGMSPESIKSHALEACRQVAALLDRKAPPVEAEGFKRWLLGVSTRVADAAKEGGFLGFGGTRVSEQETAALKEIAAALGVTPGADALAPSGGTRER